MFPTWPPLTSLLSFLASRLIVCFCLCAYVFVVERSYPPVASGWLFVCEFVCVFVFVDERSHPPVASGRPMVTD